MVAGHAKDMRDDRRRIMLRVETYLDRSRVHGIGLFAARDIEAGEVVWEHHREMEIEYSAEKWERLRGELAEQSFRALEKYAYKNGGVYMLDLGDGRFMNHSAEAPNVVGEERMTAARRIEKGEELLCDYSLFCDADDCVMGADWL